MVYPNLAEKFRNLDGLCSLAILAPHSDALNQINDDMVTTFYGGKVEYKSTDSAAEQNEADLYTIEFLNTLEPSRTSPHKLIQKTGAPVIILRNLDLPRLCNGTREVVQQLVPNCIEIIIVKGPRKGDMAMVP